MSIGNGLEIARRALAFTQLAQQSVGENIARASETGFSRRSITTSVSDSADTDTSGIGSGAARIRRMRDALADAQLRGARQAHTEAQLRSDSLNDIEIALDPLGSNSLATLWENLHSSLVEVGKEPTDMVRRGAALRSAQNLASGVNAGLLVVSQRRSALNDAVLGQVTEANRLLRLLGQINGQLGPGNAIVAQPNNDLLDQRDQILSALNEIIPVTSVESGSGQVTVTSLGQTMVDGGTVSTLQGVLPVGPGATVSVSIQQTGFVLNPQHGSIAALGRVQSDTLARIETDYTELRDFLTGTGAGSVNAQHAAGFNLAGGAGLAVMFDAPGGVLRVNPALANSPELLAAAGAAAPGDGTNAAALAAALDGVVSGTSSAQGVLTSLYTQVGQDLASSNGELQAADGFLREIGKRVDSVSGVNLDEEATRMMQYQRTYQALTKYINILDEMLQMVMSMKA
jgi:flagellar hook-associated protein 1 FlgK